MSKEQNEAEIYTEYFHQQHLNKVFFVDEKKEWWEKKLAEERQRKEENAKWKAEVYAK